MQVTLIFQPRHAVAGSGATDSAPFIAKVVFMLTVAQFLGMYFYWCGTRRLAVPRTTSAA